jgi:TolB protein
MLDDGSIINISGYQNIPLDNPDWSPDGEWIVVTGSISDSRKSICKFETADPANLLMLTQTDSVWDIAPDWSPDGDKILFTRFWLNQNFYSELWIMDSDGDNPYPLGLNGSYGRWSPDGDYVVFHFENNDGYDIGICNNDGSDFTHVTNTNMINEISPVYSPDGTKLAFTSINSTGDHDVCIMDIDGSNIKNLTENYCGGGAPKWSPSFNQIAFHQGGNVYIIDTSANNLIQVTNYSSGMKGINPDWNYNALPVSIDESLNFSSPDNENIKLYQNFPNPVIDITVIRYYLVRTSRISLDIFDLSGNKILNLENSIKSSGDHEVSFNTSNYSALISGVYLYKLISEKTHRAKKMLVLN